MPAWYAHARILHQTATRYTLLHFLLYGGNKGAILGRLGIEKIKLAISHQIYDVVPKTRRTKSHQWWIWTGYNIFLTLYRWVGIKMLRFSAISYFLQRFPMEHIEYSRGPQIFPKWTLEKVERFRNMYPNLSNLERFAHIELILERFRNKYYKDLQILF